MSSEEDFSQSGEEVVQDGVDGEDNGVQEIIMEDIISLYDKRKWKARWCLLCNGALLVKGKQEDQDSKKDVLLAGCEIRANEPVHKQDFVFCIVTPYEELLFSVATEKKLSRWIEKLNEVKDIEVTIQTKKRKQGRLMRVSKSVGGKVATSSAGKKNH